MSSKADMENKFGVYLIGISAYRKKGVEAALGKWRNCSAGIRNHVAALGHVVSTLCHPSGWKTGPDTSALCKDRMCVAPM